jgi:hypothetical protein
VHLIRLNCHSKIHSKVMKLMRHRFYVELLAVLIQLIRCHGYAQRYPPPSMRSRFGRCCEHNSILQYHLQLQCDGVRVSARTRCNAIVKNQVNEQRQQLGVADPDQSNQRLPQSVVSNTGATVAPPDSRNRMVTAASALVTFMEIRFGTRGTPEDYRHGTREWHSVDAM